MLKPRQLEKFSFPESTEAIPVDKILTLSAQTIDKIDHELKTSGMIKPEALKDALDVAHYAEACGLHDNSEQILSKLGVNTFYKELDFMENARRQGNLFYAYFGNWANEELERYPQMELIKNYLAKLVYAGKSRMEAEKKLFRKIKFRMVSLFFKPELKHELLNEAISLVQQNPYFNTDLIFANQSIRHAANYRKNKQYSHTPKLQKKVEKAVLKAQNATLRLGILAMKGYKIEQTDLKKIRTRLWKGKLFFRGLRAYPHSNLIMTLFNTHTHGIKEFLDVMRIPGNLKKAEKLKHKGIDDDANYLKAAAIYLRLGETGKATGLQGELLSQRPVFITPGYATDKSSVAAEIGKMIDNYNKWEKRIREYEMA